MKRKLLFVTYGDDESIEGLSYALDLAKMTDKGIAILLVQKARLSDRLEGLLSAISFAEEGEHDTARDILLQAEAGAKGTVPGMLEETCSRSGIATTIYLALQDTVSALRDFLGKNSSIDMVLLSPSITDKGNLSSRELKQLIKTASRPIVTMARHASIAGTL